MRSGPRPGSAWAINLGETPPLPKPAPEPELPIGQRFVLLKLRRGELAAAICEKLLLSAADTPENPGTTAMARGVATAVPGMEALDGL